LIRLLKQAGCAFVRHGRGDHDIWHSPRSAMTFPVDHKILSRHTANGVLKQAGLPKQF
jgi:predicted RNA binding protein YcfA (HicA-like mRNA interferase family)